MASSGNVSNVKCGLSNVQSVRNKTFKVRDIINDEYLDIFAIMETWSYHFYLAVIN